MRNRWIGTATVVALAVGVAWAKGGPPPGAKPAGPNVFVEDSTGKPAAGAHVLLLCPAGSDEKNQWMPASEDWTTDAKGEAVLFTSRNPSCFFAWRGEDAAFECNVPMAPGHRIRLAPGKRVLGRVVGPDGKPPAGARARVAIAGSWEWHFIDVEIAPDGSLKSPPFPPEALQHVETHVEARAPGFVEASVPIALASIDQPIEIRFVAARRAHGTIRTDPTFRDVQIHTADYYHGPTGAVAAGGSFTVDGLPPDARRLYVTSKSHAPRVIDLPDGKTDIDLGVVTLESGRAIVGKIGKGDRMTVGLIDDQGVGVVWTDVAGEGAFEFKHVGAGIDHLAARIGGPGGETWIFDRGRLEGDHDAPPFALTFESDSGKPALVESAQITWSTVDRKETTPVRMFSYTLGVTVVRLRLPGPGALRVEIAGAKPIEFDHVDVDANGGGSATVVVSR